MRQERTVQATIFEVFARHEIGCELKVISQWLDGQRGLVSLVAGDLRRQGVRQTGRRGLSAESVLRCALLKQQRQLSYEELAFHLEDSASFRAFARLPLPWSPKKSVLHQTVGALRAETWEAVNQARLASAKADKLESGAAVRIDSTVSAALMHEPSDSTLLWDAVRVMTRLLRQAAAVPGAPPIGWRDRRRVAKKRARAIDYSRGQDKKRQLYRELIAAAQATRAERQEAAAGLAAIAGTAAERWRAAVGHYLPLIARVIAQSERRVLRGEAVPASEKLVSLFEPHADIIRKGGRQVQYGHKLNLATGKSGLILDVVVEAGNPADAERFLPMLDRQIARCGRAPRQTAADYNIEETLTYYRLPLPHHKHMKSTNMLERLNQELKRRTHVVRIFPNGDSCLRLVRALAVETHENWLEQHRYLNMDDLREHKKEALRRAA